VLAVTALERCGYRILQAATATRDDAGGEHDGRSLAALRRVLSESACPSCYAVSSRSGPDTKILLMSGYSQERIPTRHRRAQHGVPAQAVHDSPAHRPCVRCWIPIPSIPDKGKSRD